MIAISTYSGECDGLGYAAELAGIEVAAYCEADPKRRAKLAEKHPGKPIFASDEELTYAALRDLGIHPDLLFGGPPCQPFSCAGAQRGVDDPRHRWPEMLRLIRECRPRWVLVENVGRFVNLALDLVWADLEAEGYEVGPVVLPALAVGAPHRRDRCFVVACAGGGRSCEPRVCEERPRGAKVIGAGENCVADTDGAGSQAGASIANRQNSGSGSGGLERRGDGRSLAHSLGAREPQPGGQLAQRGRWTIDSGESLVSAQSIRSGQGSVSWRDETQQPMLDCGDAHALWRAVESRLGRVLDGVSDRLDALRWPAWRGQEQHSWEPPRTVRGMKDRPRRIESLGLAVVPGQAYPIIALIKEMDDILHGR